MQEPNALQWVIFSPEPNVEGDHHVIPTNDLFPHELSEHCWCKPDDDPEVPMEFVWHHNAKDHREDYFPGGRKMH